MPRISLAGPPFAWVLRPVPYLHGWVRDRMREGEKVLGAPVPEAVQCKFSGIGWTFSWHHERGHEFSWAFVSMAPAGYLVWDWRIDHFLSDGKQRIPPWVHADELEEAADFLSLPVVVFMALYTLTPPRGGENWSR